MNLSELYQAFRPVFERKFLLANAKFERVIWYMQIPPWDLALHFIDDVPHSSILAINFNGIAAMHHFVNDYFEYIFTVEEVQVNVFKVIA